MLHSRLCRKEANVALRGLQSWMGYQRRWTGPSWRGWVESMLAHAKLSKMFWVEALMTTTYVINRSPSVPLDGDIPQRVWIYKDLSYWRLRVFGCLAYVHVSKDQRGILYPKSRPCIFLGYGDDEFGYPLWHLAKKKVIRSRNIIFMEEKTIVGWETENKFPTTESSPIDAEPNREEVDSIEI